MNYMIFPGIEPKPDYSRLDPSLIKQIFEGTFYKKAETKGRDVKLHVYFKTEEAALKWFKEVWEPLIDKEIKDWAEAMSTEHKLLEGGRSSTEI